MKTYLASVFELLSVVIVLLMTLLLQFVFSELPCPLCLLQRIGFIGVAYGIILNLRFGFRPSHYAIIILSGLFTSFVALRQIALHVIPGTPAYGSALFGYHLYTWSFVVAMLIVVGSTLLLGIDRQYQKRVALPTEWRKVVHLLFAMTCFIIIVNVFSTFMLCGLGYCPDNPTAYSFN